MVQMNGNKYKPTPIDKLALFRGLMTGEHAYVGPFHVTIDVSSRCNIRCLGCRYQDPNIDFSSLGGNEVRDIPVDLVKQLCRELKPMRTNALVLTGEGEPFLHPRIFDIISEIKQNGYHLTARSNGTLLTEDAAHKLVDAGVDIFKVSLWATSLEEYAELYPKTKTNNFTKVLEGLKLLARVKKARKSRLPVTLIHHVISRHNFHTIDKMIDIAHETGCDGVYFAPFKAWENAHTDAFLSPDEEVELERLLAKAREKSNALSLLHNVSGTLERFRTGNNVWEKFPCYLGWFHARVKLDGTVLPCDPYKRPMGTLKERRMSDIWNDPAYRDFRRKGLTRKGLAEISKKSDCGFCCHLVPNARMHRVVKWMRPFILKSWMG